MDVKEAVKVAKGYIAELYKGEGAENIGLEEVEYDKETQTWYVTVGFSRPWDREPESVQQMLQIGFGPRKMRRDMKVVAVDAGAATVLSVRNRER